MEFLEVIPVWFYAIVAVILIPTLAFLLVRGISFSFKGLKVDTKRAEDNPNDIQIPISHLIQFRKLRHDIKEDILVSKGEFQAHFRTLFINYLKEEGIEHTGIENHEFVEMYEGYLEGALDTVFDPMVKKVIFGNHFPVRKVDKDGNYTESEKDYENRFFEKLTRPTTYTILRMTKNKISSDWKIKISRSKYEKDFVSSQKNMKILLGKMSDLIVKSRERRDHVFEQIHFQDGTSIEMIKFEWEMVYG